MVSFTRVRGTRDFIPPLSLKRERILDIIRETYREFGFEPWDVAALQTAEVLTLKGGEEIRKELYLFEDKGGREIGLRFDLTLPSALVVASNPQLALPIKRYIIGKAWRYDRPQAGRFREFLQADVDIFGSKELLADAECVAAVYTALRKIGIEAEVRVNNIGLVKTILSEMSLNGDALQRFLRAVDKWYKIGEDEVRKELGELEKYLDTYLKNAERIEESLTRLFDYLDDFSVKWRFDPFIVRGLDYYTGPVFETFVDRPVSIASGGRYDGLVRLLGGRDVPATGMSIGVDRLLDLYEEKVSVPRRADVFVAVLPGFEEKAIMLSQLLRARGIKTYMDVSGRKLGKQLSFAEQLGIPLVVIAGKELEENKVPLKFLEERKQEVVPLSKLADKILEYLNRI